jgi:hypothetical protein
VGLVLGPGMRRRGMQRQQQRINLSRNPLMHACTGSDLPRPAHENQYPIGIFLPAFGQLIIFFRHYLRIDGEERPRPITGHGVGRSREQRRRIGVGIFYACG